MMFIDEITEGKLCKSFRKYHDLTLVAYYICTLLHIHHVYDHRKHILQDRYCHKIFAPKSWNNIQSENRNINSLIKITLRTLFVWRDSSYDEYVTNASKTGNTANTCAHQRPSYTTHDPMSMTPQNLISHDNECETSTCYEVRISNSKTFMNKKCHQTCIPGLLK